MTEPTDEELKAAVAKVLGLRRFGVDEDNWVWVNPEYPTQTLEWSQELSKDWNVLMAAVGELEYEEGTAFQRVVTAQPRWHVRFKTRGYSADFTYGNVESEARALALCIYHVVEEK